MPARNTPAKFSASALVQRGAAEACWPWVGHKDRDGYGEVKMAGHRFRAHRLAWQVANGDIPPSLQVLHRCDVPACCNPAHLFLGTVKDNFDDMVSKNRVRLVSNGLPPSYGEKNPSSKLTEPDVRQIRSITGMSLSGIAKLYGVSAPTIRSIRRREYWPHVA